MSDDKKPDIANASRAAMKYGATPTTTLGALFVAWTLWFAPAEERATEAIEAITKSQAALVDRVGDLESLIQAERIQRLSLTASVARNETDIAKITDKIDLLGSKIDGLRADILTRMLEDRD
jgi:hypothetical protein